MNSLYAIVKKLSDKEVKLFKRLFLTRSKNGESKRNELFNAILKSNKPDDVRRFVHEQQYSRQNYYQMCKRLRENLCDLLLSFHTSNKANKSFFEEMECHKRLYFVKILLDRNINDQAEQVLKEVIATSKKYHFSEIFFEAISLKNKYFPLIEKQETQADHAGEFKELEDNLCQNKYLQQYLIASVVENHECDVSLRESLVEFIYEYGFESENEFIDQVFEVNHCFCKKEFEQAYSFLMKLSDELYTGPRMEASTKGLIYLEKAKACIGMDDHQKGLYWLDQAEFHLKHLEHWLPIIYELKYTLAIKSGDFDEQANLLDQVNQLEVPFEQTHHMAKWNLYAAWHYYLKGDLKKVVKLANSKKSSGMKSQRAYLLLKMLEVMSIYQLHDEDWFFYKSESLRKQLSRKLSKDDRLSILFSIIKSTLSKPKEELQTIEIKLLKLEDNYPWHPLSYELVNVSNLLFSIVPNSHAARALDSINS